MLYLISITIFFADRRSVRGGHPHSSCRRRQGDLVSSDMYNKLFTLHGVVMIFFFLIPSIPAVLGNFLLPIMIGAKDLAFPRINLLSWYIYIVGAIITLAAVFSGGLDTGWTFYTPYSSVSSQTAVTTAAPRRVRHRLLVDSHRPELHRHRAPHARAGHDVVPHAALRVGAVRHEPRDDPRHAGHRDHRAARCG